MTKEKLGLPWEIDGYGYIQNKNEEWVGVVGVEERDFILKAVNNHHALVEALGDALDAIDFDSLSLEDAKRVEKADKALEAVK